MYITEYYNTDNDKRLNCPLLNSLNDLFFDYRYDIITKYKKSFVHYQCGSSIASRGVVNDFATRGNGILVFVINHTYIPYYRITDVKLHNAY